MHCRSGFDWGHGKLLCHLMLDTTFAVAAAAAVHESVHAVQHVAVAVPLAEAQMVEELACWSEISIARPAQKI